MTMGKRMIKAGCLAPAAAAMLMAGCAARDIASDQEWHEFVQAHVAAMTNRLAKIVGDDGVAAGISGGGGGAMVAGGEGAFPVVVEPASECDPADAVSFASLSWSYGGFRGGEAVLSGDCEIADLRVSSSGMSYRWTRGGCESLGAHTKTDSGETLACLFVRDRAGSWRGGKFDWISTSRTSRDWKNVRSGYHGWPADAIETATDYAFVIVSKDGKRRSNVIVRGK